MDIVHVHDVPRFAYIWCCLIRLLVALRWWVHKTRNCRKKRANEKKLGEKTSIRSSTRRGLCAIIKMWCVCQPCVQRAAEWIEYYTQTRTETCYRRMKINVGMAGLSCQRCRRRFFFFIHSLNSNIHSHRAVNKWFFSLLSPSEQEKIMTKMRKADIN